MDFLASDGIRSGHFMAKSKRMMSRLTSRLQTEKIVQALILFTCLGAVTRAQALSPDLTELSIEDLMQVKVVSAAKVEQPLRDTAAAIFVITADDIRRSGVTNLMEALRLAPGVEVARIDSSRWATPFAVSTVGSPTNCW